MNYLQLTNKKSDKKLSRQKLSASNIAEAGENENQEVQTLTEIKAVDHAVIIRKNEYNQHYYND